MYAAAGGASLASRQARQRQRQQKKQQLQARLHPPKVVAIPAAELGASTPTRQSRQFHQLPTNYLRTPQAQARKLSSSYTTQSRLLLPIDEGDTQSVLNLRMHSHAHGQHSHSHGHSHQHQQLHHHHHLQQQQQQHHTGYGKHAQNFQQYGHSHSHGRVSPKLVHRHSGGSGGSGFHQAHLPKSATATLPLVSQFGIDSEAEAEATTPTTPSGVADAIKTTATAAAGTPPPPAQPRPPPTTLIVETETETETEHEHDAIALPQPHDAIIVTPATPMASPGHVAKLRDEDISQAAASERQPLTAAEPVDDDDEPMQPPTGPLERKCSVYRMRRSDAFEHEVVAGAGSGVKRQLRELQFNYQQQQQYEPLLTDEPQLIFKGTPTGRKLQVCAYCVEGICVCEHVECAQGRAAWLERGRRCSVQEAEKQATCSRRWVKRNRIQDASLGGSSDDEDFLGVLRGPSTFANAFLYVGLGTVALGLVIAFVGTGEKGFKTVELRLIGPSLIALGLICCILRILFCICPSHCIASSKTRKKNGNKVDADHTTSLLRGENKRVSIARSSSMQPKYPTTHRRSQSKMLNEGMEALRQIATTSLFMQNEQKPSNRVVPIIKEPDNQTEAALEMKKLDPPIQMREVGYREEGKASSKGPVNKAQPAKNSVGTQMFDPMDPRATSATATASGQTQTITSPTTTDPSSTSTPTAYNSSSASNQTIFKATPAIRQTERTIPPPQGTVTNSVGKLTRQRVVFNQDEHPQKHIAFEQSQSLSSSSTVKDSIDGDLLMETSLMGVTPIKATREDHIALLTPKTTHNPVATTSPFAMPTATTATTVFSATPFYPTATAFGGAVSTTAYDLPPAMPHTYSYSRLGAADRETLIRGPLGMTASPSTYTLPASAAATPVTTPATNASTAAVGLIPTSTPTSQASLPIGQHHQQSAIPGQVFDTRPSTSAYARLGASIQPTPGLTSIPMTSMTQLQNTSMPMSYNFPAPLSSSASSSASSNVRTPSIGVSTAASLAPPPALPVNKFEPELLLSPAKLGQ